MTRGLHASGSPRVSVVIASYRWPEALHLSLAGALTQTVTDIEVLVVEDGRDRASQAVVRATGDPRARWLHLRRNVGSQTGPNAFGWRHARAPVIAYLGHDDLWHPEHLEHLLTALTAEVDIAHATTLMLGHPDGRDLLAGGQAWRPGAFVPPSSIAHRRDGLRVGRWPLSAGGRLHVDYDFLLRSEAAGARFAATGQPTVFKYSASWGMDSYRTRDVSQQRALVDRLASDPMLGLHMEAAARTLGAAPTLAYEAPAGAPGAVADYTRRQRGLPARFAAPCHRWEADSPWRQPGWHAAEHDADGRALRWTGAEARASVRLDPPRARTYVVTVEIAHVVDESQLHTLVLDVDGTPLTATTSRQAGGSHVVQASARRRSRGRDPIEIGLSVPLLRPSEVDAASPDERQLGVAVRSISVG